MLRKVALAILLGAGACASSGGGGRHAEHVAPPSAPAGGEGEAMGGGGEASGSEQAPEVVHSGKTFKLDYSGATARYEKGARCGGDDSPEQVLGQPDQKNEMQMGRDKVVTFGFRFPEGTLLIRCRADHVEVARTLK